MLITKGAKTDNIKIGNIVVVNKDKNQNYSLLLKVDPAFLRFGQSFKVCLTDPHPKHEPPFLYNPFSFLLHSLAICPFCPQ